ncbi:hypothetical protein [Aestuariivirga litoralis]|uniref:hypothetical protein n=1 Tax=Aestuariivirga litoralis TaxID=2650924 RepID=UPI0018C71C31|nr:hypothetical protein [Aestuariivirga litoralis]MBG1232974.1 hypothetical protein [Aestuariivirga litoralis]
MTTYHGKGGVVKIGANTVAQVKSWTFTQSAETQDTSVMGVDDETHLVGRRSASGSISCLYDETDATGQEVMVAGASVSLVLNPAGTTVTRKNRSFTATITKIDEPVNDNGVITRSFDFKVNGAATRGTN